MAKKKSSKKQAKKKTAENKTNVGFLMDGGNAMIFNDVDGEGFSGDPRLFMEKMMRDVGRKLNSLDLSQEELANVDLTRLINSMPTPEASTPREQAEDVVFDARATDDPKKKIEIAKKALKIDPNNVEALVILAEHKSQNVFEAIDGYRKAIAAGERGFGEDFMRENVGHFWSIPETRPYMRALEELAGILRGVLMEEGGLPRNNEEAVEIYRKLLRLNPGDNQGIRHKLLYFLLELGKDDEAEELYGQYAGDHSAWWIYGRPLLDFRKGVVIRRFHVNRCKKRLNITNIFLFTYLVESLFLRHLRDITALATPTKRRIT